MSSIEETLASREKTHGPAWWVTGVLIRELRATYPEGWDNLINSGYSYSWIIILNKLVRALTTPHEADHWHDIQGYARLTEEFIKLIQGDERNVSGK
jgi:hypothetical protein